MEVIRRTKRKVQETMKVRNGGCFGEIGNLGNSLWKLFLMISYLIFHFGGSIKAQSTSYAQETCKEWRIYTYECTRTRTHKLHKQNNHKLNIAIKVRNKKNQPKVLSCIDI